MCRMTANEIMPHAIAIVIMAEGEVDLKKFSQGCTYAPGKSQPRILKDFTSQSKDELGSQVLLVVCAKDSLKVFNGCTPVSNPGPSV